MRRARRGGVLRHDDALLRGLGRGRPSQVRVLEGREAQQPADIPRPAGGRRRQPHRIRHLRRQHLRGAHADGVHRQDVSQVRLRQAHRRGGCRPAVEKEHSRPEGGRLRVHRRGQAKERQRGGEKGHPRPRPEKRRCTGHQPSRRDKDGRVQDGKPYRQGQEDPTARLGPAGEEAGERTADQGKHQQQGLQQVPEDGRGRENLHRLRQVRRRRGLGRHQGLCHEHQPLERGGNRQVFRPVAHRAGVPHEQDRLAGQTHLPQAQEQDRGAHLHLLHGIHNHA